MTTPEAAIEHLDPDVAEVRALIAASDAFYDGLYPAESTHLESSADLKRPDVLFIGCHQAGVRARTISGQGTVQENHAISRN
jgi:carbonic anhydrase